MVRGRTASRRRGWAPWILVPVALALDTAAALGLAGHPFPLGVIVPDAALLGAPLLVYGSLAFVALRSWPLGSRLAAATVLLAIHVALVGFHAVGYVGLWSLPLPAALRLAHARSPLIPLLQLVWVPILALPLATLIRSRPRPASPRRGPVRIPVEVLLSRASHAGPRGRTQPGREVRVDASGPGVAPAAAAEAVTAVEPEPAPSASAPAVLPPTVGETLDEVSVIPPPTPASDRQALAPRPIWFDDLVGTSTHTVPAAWPSVEAAGEARASDGPTAIPVAPEATTDGEGEGAGARAREGEWADADHATEDEPPRVADPAPTMEIAVPDVPAAEAPPSAAEPPLDLDVVARSFAPYGPLLSRDRLVAVDWIPSPDAAVVCVAPRDMPRGRVARLARHLVPVLEAAEARSTPGPIRRLSLRGADGVIVLTPLDGAVLVAAARRRGALALLEALSARIVPGRGGLEAAPPASDAAPMAAVDASVTGAVRVAVPGAMLDVLAPAGIAAASVGDLAGRLLAAIAADADGAGALHALSVDFGTCRLIVHPVHGDSRPPRFLAVVGGPERPGLLGCRTERAARALREAS